MPEVVNTSSLQGLVHDIKSDDDKRPSMIKVENVSMVFNMANEQLNSLKEYFIALAKNELRFKEFRALNDISIDVKKGDVFGIMGTNGSGKSTLLKIIAGVLEPTSGTCTVKGNIAPLIELGAGFDFELTATENIYLNGALLGYSKEFIDANFDEIVDFAEIRQFLDMPLKNYSSGMVARIAFAIATVIVPEILIVDEVLSVGDFMFQQKCEQRIQSLIKEHGVTVLIVSHNNEQVARLCNKVAWIEKGHMRMQGSADEVCPIYALLGGREGSSGAEQVIINVFGKEVPDEYEFESIDCPTRHSNAVLYAETLAQLRSASPETIYMVNANNCAACGVVSILACRNNAYMLPIEAEYIPEPVLDALSAIQPKHIRIFSSADINVAFVTKQLDFLAISAEVSSVEADSMSQLANMCYEETDKGNWSDLAILSFHELFSDMVTFLPFCCSESVPYFFLDEPGKISEKTFENVTKNFKEVVVLCRPEVAGEDILKRLEDTGLSITNLYANDMCGIVAAINDWVADYRTIHDLKPMDKAYLCSIWHLDRMYCLGPLAAYRNAVFLLEDPAELDSVSKTLKYIGDHNLTTDDVVLVGNDTDFSDLDKSLIVRAMV